MTTLGGFRAELSRRNGVTQKQNQTQPQKKRKRKAKKGKKNKPKKAMTPFMVFSKETRKILVANHPGLTFSEIGKELGARWRSLSDAEKQVYVMKANEDYQRFLTETEQIEAQDPTKKKKTIEEKKQTKVKKSISAYLYFCNAHRAQVKARHPEMKMVEIQRLLAEKWMKSSPAVKLPFEKQAEADREKYNNDIQHTISEADKVKRKKISEGRTHQASVKPAKNVKFEVMDTNLPITKNHKTESVENLHRLLGLDTSTMPMDLKDFSFPFLPDSEPLEFS